MRGTYQLIALDLDGTLVRSDQTISPHTSEALIHLQEQGTKIVIASGRPTFGTIPAAEALRLKDFGGYVMSYNGGEIYDYKNDEVLHSQTLDKSTLPHLYSYANEHGCPIMTYIGKHVVSEVDDNDYIRYSSMRNRMEIKKIRSFLETTNHADIVKCIIVGSPTLLPSLEKELQMMLQDKAGVFRSEPFFLEIVPKGIDKAKGLDILSRETGLSRENIVAFGDGFNDLSMLQYAGLGVAMGNASDEIKKAADMVAPSNDDDGIVHALQQIGLF